MPLQPLDELLDCNAGTGGLPFPLVGIQLKMDQV